MPIRTHHNRYDVLIELLRKMLDQITDSSQIIAICAAIWSEREHESPPPPPITANTLPAASADALATVPTSRSNSGSSGSSGSGLLSQTAFAKSVAETAARVHAHAQHAASASSSSAAPHFHVAEAAAAEARPTNPSTATQQRHSGFGKWPSKLVGSRYYEPYKPYASDGGVRSPGLPDLWGVKVAGKTAAGMPSLSTTGTASLFAGYAGGLGVGGKGVSAATAAAGGQETATGLLDDTAYDASKINLFRFGPEQSRSSLGTAGVAAFPSSNAGVGSQHTSATADVAGSQSATSAAAAAATDGDSAGCDGDSKGALVGGSRYFGRPSDVAVMSPFALVGTADNDYSVSRTEVLGKLVEQCRGAGPTPPSTAAATSLDGDVEEDFRR